MGKNAKKSKKEASENPLEDPLEIEEDRGASKRTCSGGIVLAVLLVFIVVCAVFVCYLLVVNFSIVNSGGVDDIKGVVADQPGQNSKRIGTSRGCFRSQRLEGVSIHSPMCLHQRKLIKGYTLRDNCQNAGVHMINCEPCHRQVFSDARLHWPIETKPLSWIQSMEDKGRIHWIQGSTVVFNFIMIPSVKNIAHFAGFVLFYHHIKENYKYYGLNSSDIKLILSADSTFMPLLLKSDSWHKGLLDILLVDEESIHVLNLKKPALKKHTIIPMSLEQMIFPGALGDNLLCFENLIVPSFMKGRYFIPDHELHQRPFSHVPRDAIKFREKMVKKLGMSNTRERSLVYLARDTTRKFDYLTETSLVRMLTKFCNDNTLKYSRVNFLGQSFRNQVESVSKSAISIGVHGANLVNTMFMPAKSVLIEIMPYRFDHIMYINGSESGLHYFKYMITFERESPDLGQFDSYQRCIYESNECKVFYRGDNRRLVMNDVDFQNVEKILHKAVQIVNDNL